MEETKKRKKERKNVSYSIFSFTRKRNSLYPVQIIGIVTIEHVSLTRYIESECRGNAINS